jgi:hypothetical protein
MDSPAFDCIKFIIALCILQMFWANYPLITIIIAIIVFATIVIRITTQKTVFSPPPPRSAAPPPPVTSSAAPPPPSPPPPPPPSVTNSANVTTNVINVAKQRFQEYVRRETFLDFSPTVYSTVYLIQDGVPNFWTTWVKSQIDFIATSALNIIQNTVYVIIPLHLTWFLDQHRQIANTICDKLNIKPPQRDTIIGNEIDGQSNAYQQGGPAWGPGKFPTFNFNLEAINSKNLLLTDTMGMLQTPGHEFFHVIQTSSLRNNMFFLPAWFVEGSAVFIGTSVADKTKPVPWYTYELARSWVLNRNNEIVQKYKLSEIVINIKNPATDPDPYGIGCIAVEYMIAWFGMKNFTDIFINAGEYIAANKPTTQPNDPYNPIVFENSFLKATGVQLQTFYESFESVRTLLGFNRTGPIVRTDIPQSPEVTADSLILSHLYNPESV